MVAALEPAGHRAATAARGPCADPGAAVNAYERVVLPWLIHWVMRAPQLAPYRQRATAGAQGRVLEPGIGSGYNLPYYGEAVQAVVGVDPSARLLGFACRAPRPPGLALELHPLEAAWLPFPDASFDAVVMTWVLCSVPDVPQALAELRRVLRPGGRLHFVEHGLAPAPRVAAWQHRLTPWWRRVAGGCHLDRPIDALLRSGGFRLEHLQRGYAPGTGAAAHWLAYMYEGVAVPD